jgi:hypothetical protein
VTTALISTLAVNIVARMDQLSGQLNQAQGMFAKFDSHVGRSLGSLQSIEAMFTGSALVIGANKLADAYMGVADSILAAEKAGSRAFSSEQIESVRAMQSEVRNLASAFTDAAQQSVVASSGMVNSAAAFLNRTSGGPTADAAAGEGSWIGKGNFNSLVEMFGGKTEDRSGIMEGNRIFNEGVKRRTQLKDQGVMNDAGDMISNEVSFKPLMSMMKSAIATGTDAMERLGPIAQTLTDNVYLAKASEDARVGRNHQRFKDAMGQGMDRQSSRLSALSGDSVEGFAAMRANVTQSLQQEAVKLAREQLQVQKDMLESFEGGNFLSSDDLGI